MKQQHYLLIFFLIYILAMTPSIIEAQPPVSPLVQKGWTEPTSYNELSEFVEQLDKSSEFIERKVIGKSVEGRNIYALLFSDGEFGKDVTKIKVLIFAQQHGNEQSGKEGALLLAAELAKPEHRELFKRMDLALIPQMNPDGSEANRRRNANSMDLNRNHMILTEPETQALHSFFDTYLFEVSMDVHEYSPYGDEWKTIGFRKNSEVTVGTTTNLDVSGKIRTFSKDKYLPFILDYLKKQGFSSFEYSPGDPPGQGYTRHSTFDINDGRQSLGILNTLAFIQEGMNGEDNFKDNIRTRSEGQKAGMMGLLQFVKENSSKIRKLVRKERMTLPGSNGHTEIALHSDHVADGSFLELPVYSWKTGKDSTVLIKDYRPKVISTLSVRIPHSYLLSGQNKELLEWAERHHLNLVPYKPGKSDKLQQYFITGIDSIDFEGDITVNPKVEIHDIHSENLEGQYFVLETSQLKGSMICLALEPQSMLGLVTYSKFAHLIRKGEYFPIIRLLK
ncbi:MAG: hypothetical protein IPH45_00075 [Bacteroidales bacterium]|nr:hypothetical protein [Bacteroidales bacterium]